MDFSARNPSIVQTGEAHLKARELRRNLRASVLDGATYSLMVGLGETYLPAFALALGMSGLVTGWVASLPLVAGGVFQLFSPLALQRLKSHRRWVVLCVVLQALCFLPLTVAAAYGTLSVALFFLITTLYWASGLASGPAWNAWIETLVPREVRPKFFAWRSRVAQSCLLAAFVGGGLLLQNSIGWSRPILAFGGLFLGAMACRILSAVFLWMKSEPKPPSANAFRFSIRENWHDFRKGANGRLLLYFLLVQFSVWMAAPFFTPFMFLQLKLSYTGFMLLTAASLIGKILAFPLMGRLAQRFGTRRLLWLGGLGIAPLPLMWLVSDSFGWLLAVNLFAGCFWAAYELATILLFFETIPNEKRTGVLTIFNMGNTLAQTTGALLGGALFGLLPGGYVLIFLVSTVARIMCLVFLKRASAPNVAVVPVTMRVVGVRPSAGSIDRPVLASIGEAEG